MSLETWLKEADRKTELAKEASVQPTLDQMSVDELEEMMNKLGMANPLVPQKPEPVKVSAVSPTAALQAQILAGFMDKIAYVSPEGLSALAFSAADMMKIAMDPVLRQAVEDFNKGVKVDKGRQALMHAARQIDAPSHKPKPAQKVFFSQLSSKTPERSAATESLLNAARKIDAPESKKVRQSVKAAVDNVSNKAAPPKVRSSLPHPKVPSSSSRSKALSETGSEVASRASRVIKWLGKHKRKAAIGAGLLALTGAGAATYANRDKLFDDK